MQKKKFAIKKKDAIIPYIRKRTYSKYSVNTEYSEYAVFNSKSGLSNILYFFVKFWLFDYEAILSIYEIFMEYSMFRILRKYKIRNIPPFAGPYPLPITFFGRVSKEEKCYLVTCIKSRSPILIPSSSYFLKS